MNHRSDAFFECVGIAVVFWALIALNVWGKPLLGLVYVSLPHKDVLQPSKWLIHARDG